MRRFRFEYGASPLHLIAVLAAFAVAGYGAIQLLNRLEPVGIISWFAGAIVAHDFLLLPLYSALGLVAYAIARAGLVHPPRVAALNHVRVPAVLSGLLFLVWFPLILGLNAPKFEEASGRTADGYLTRWLIITAALFALSGLVYAVRLWRAKWRPYAEPRPRGEAREPPPPT